MTIARLDTPLRVTWEFHSPTAVIAPAAALTVAERLVDAGLFYVTLLARPLAHPVIAEVLAILTGSGIQVQATFNGTEEEWQGLATFESVPEVCVDADGGIFLAALRRLRRLRRLRARRGNTGA